MTMRASTTTNERPRFSFLSCILRRVQLSYDFYCIRRVLRMRHNRSAPCRYRFLQMPGCIPLIEPCQIVFTGNFEYITTWTRLRTQNRPVCSLPTSSRVFESEKTASGHAKSYIAQSFCSSHQHLIRPLESKAFGIKTSRRETNAIAQTRSLSGLSCIRYGHLRVSSGYIAR